MAERGESDSDYDDSQPEIQLPMAVLRRYLALLQGQGGGQLIVDADEDEDDWETEDDDVGGVPAPAPTEDIQSSDLASELKATDPPSILGRRSSSAFDMIMGRETSHRRRVFTQHDKQRVGRRFIPNVYSGELAEYPSQAFCGRYSKDGTRFISAVQDQILRVYDTTVNEWSLQQEVEAREIGWSIIDTDISPDQSFCVYSSWSECVHLVKLGTPREVHLPLNMRPESHGRFCMFSVKISPDNKEVLGGSSDQNVYLYDIENKRRTERILAHGDDINSVCWADESGQVFFSASDDSTCKMWDKRNLRPHRRAEGVFVGHCDGLTHVSSKGDGRYLITNSKDQSIKLWDTRKMASSNAEVAPPPRRRHWDYRSDRMGAAEAARRRHPSDSSLMTYRGHRVLQTLIRCYFSPAATTGFRYIYTGSHNGSVYIYDVLTGEIVRTLDHHRGLVRDVSWHPTEPSIVSTSWDGTLGHWTYDPDLNLTPLAQTPTSAPPGSGGRRFSGLFD